MGTIINERGYAQFDNGQVFAEVNVLAGGKIEIMDWRTSNPAQGHSEAALRELRQEWRVIKVVDATAAAMPFWLKMQERGLVDEVHPEAVPGLTP